MSRPKPIKAKLTKVMPVGPWDRFIWQLPASNQTYDQIVETVARAVYRCQPFAKHMAWGDLEEDQHKEWYRVAARAALADLDINRPTK